MTCSNTRWPGTGAGRESVRPPGQDFVDHAGAIPGIDEADTVADGYRVDVFHFTHLADVVPQ
jgi:hypothetical protein